MHAHHTSSPDPAVARATKHSGLFGIYTKQAAVFIYYYIITLFNYTIMVISI